MLVATARSWAYRLRLGRCRPGNSSGSRAHVRRENMAKQKVPGSREEESWFSEEQLENLELADEVQDDLKSPIPTQMVSNGEYLPTPQTPEQKQVERRIRELAGVASRKLGMSRRQFLAGSGGMAVAFIAMNEVHAAEFFTVSPDEVWGSRSNQPPRNL